MSPAGNTKKTVYIDVDDEITAIIDKVKSTKESIIALVLPRRATMLQSVVNMKLLKRAADQSAKKVVLITSEPTLMPLAGVAGLHVARNLQSRPFLPNPNQPEPESSPAGAGSKAHDAPIDPNTPIGDLADPKSAEKEKPIEIDNRKSPDVPPIPPNPRDGKGIAKKEKSPKDKSKKVPNFNKFRVLLLAGIAALILLIGFGYWALALAPKANVTLRTESNETTANASFAADTGADEINLEEEVLPARLEEEQRAVTEKSPSTGEKDNGTKASGRVTLRNCTDNEVTVPAGTRVSSGNLTFITEKSAALDDDELDSNGNCKNSGDHTRTVAVVAENNGDQYNVGPRTYTVSGYSSVIASGGEMKGGTTKLVKVVTAEDVEAAKKKITDRQNEMVTQLKDELKDRGYIGIVDSFNAGEPTFTVTPEIGAEAPEVSVAGQITYSMLGVKEDDLKKIIEDQSKDEIDTSRQSIIDYGFEEATYQVGDRGETTTQLSVETTLIVGPEINQDELKGELAGKKRAEAEELLKDRPGVTEARIEFSPFWVNKVPGKDAKVNFVIEQADGTPIDP